MRGLFLLIFAIYSLDVFSQCVPYPGPQIDVGIEDPVGPANIVTSPIVPTIPANTIITGSIGILQEGPCLITGNFLWVFADATTATVSFPYTTTKEIAAVRLTTNTDCSPIDPNAEPSELEFSIIGACTTPACPMTPTGSGGNATICGNENFSFPSRSCSNGTLRWYENSSGTGTFYTGPTVSPSSTITYYPFCFTTCLSPAGSPVTATVICSSTAAASASTYTWTGCVSIDWFDPCNWNTGTVPTTAKSVVIPNVTNDPRIVGGTANCFQLTIQTGAIVNLVSTSGGILNVTKP